MNLLAVETTGPFASVAIINEKNVIRSASSDRKLSHLQNLLPMAGELLKKCELELNDLTHIAASVGPGSFTGIRIGVSTARALAQTLGLPVISVPTLQAFVWNVPDHDGLFCPIFDARREQVYAGAYYREGERCITAVKGGAYSIDEYLTLVEAFDPAHTKKILLFGDGLAVYGQTVKDWGIAVKRRSENDEEALREATLCEAAEEDRFQKASSVAALAQTLLDAGEAKSFEALRPVYIRKAEAERKLEERLAQERA